MRGNCLPVLLLFLFGLGISQAQETCTLRGEIRDSLNLPVFDASVSAFNSKNEGAGFTFSDLDGFFKLDLPCGETYEVEFEHMDFASKEERVELLKSKLIKITMERSVITLKEAVIEARQPITVKGDTIEYDADSFRTKADESLEDLLKKLPGLEVENGKVYYEGKEITTIKVGNREVLGGNTKLLTKNLPADAVDKVQLNKKFKANPFSNALSSDEEAMLNIELKEDKKSLIFGSVTMGGDADKHDDEQAKLFYFSPKIDATSITDYNTYGKQVFTREDYFTFLGGMSQFTEDGSSFSLREEPSGISLGSAQDASNMNSFLSALHFGYEPNNKWNTGGFLLFNNNHFDFKSRQERISEDFNLRDENDNKQHLLSTLGRFRVNFNPNRREQFKYKMTFNYLENENKQLSNTFLNDNPTGIRDNITDKNSFSLKQNLTYISKIGRDDNLGFYLRHQLYNDRPDLSIISDSVPIVIDTLDFLDLRQHQKFITNKIQVYSIYNHLLTHTINLRFKAGANFSHQTLKNDIFLSNTLVREEPFYTDSKFDYSELYADFTYTQKIGVLKFDAGVGIHSFNEKTKVVGDERKRNFAKLFPHFNAEINLANSQRINFNYSLDYSLPNLMDLSDGYLVQSYYSVYHGFLGLKESLAHSLSLNYGYFNSFNFLNFYTGITYRKSEDNIINRSNVTRFPQINSVINSPRDDNFLSAYLGGSKRFSRHYSLRWNGSLSYMDYYTQIRLLDYGSGVPEPVDEETHTTSFTQSYTLTNQFRIKKMLELDLGLSYMQSEFKSTTNNTFKTWRPFAKTAWSISDKFLLQSDFSLRLQYQEGKQINNYKDLNASLRYHVAKNTYVSFISGNILQSKSIVNTSFDAATNQTIINAKDVLGRYFLVQLRYKF